MFIDNNAKDWILKELTIIQFFEFVNYDNELKSKQPQAKEVKSLRDLKDLAKRLNS